jgi:ubiquitin carboxyl-terminal hydrolase 36/42
VTARAQLKCRECGFASNKFDPFLDLALELGEGARDLEGALAHFSKVEVLDKDNKWLCGGCNRRVCARKQLTVRHAPRVLTIQLKRFKYGRFGRKIGHHVAFPVALTLKDCLSDTALAEGGPVRYGLMGVLVHSGTSAGVGHYFSFVRAPNGVWHRADDSYVERVSVQTVTSQCAYLLFYGRDVAAAAAAPAADAVGAEAGGGGSRPRGVSLDATDYAALRARMAAEAAAATAAAAAAAAAGAARPRRLSVGAVDDDEDEEGAGDTAALGAFVRGHAGTEGSLSALAGVTWGGGGKAGAGGGGGGGSSSGGGGMKRERPADGGARAAVCVCLAS